ncbi:uncharacterized protein LOC130732553 [Lotus japonicus]|uniref:uncharacterized protein LOC130732553 n=1 Tax=Lotus japonicus TaxID=34305 RepID=UPI00258CF665|nr:uncharacterized protein LOC130732553 [Lotus japonicus]
MASLILLFSELVQNHEWNAAALLAAYPPSSYSSCCAAARKPLKDYEGGIMEQEQNSQKTEEVVMTENPMESRVSLDFVWP